MKDSAAAWTLDSVLGPGGVWEEEARQLGLDPAGACNIGAICSDRHVSLGRGGDPALRRDASCLG